MPPPTRPIARALIGVLVGAVVLLGACGDDDGPAAGTDSTTTTTSPSSTTSEATAVVTTTSSTVPELGAPCPEGPEPAGEVIDGRPLPADVDGDGVPDDVTVGIVDDRTIEVVVEFAAGGRTVATYDDDSVATFAAIRIERVADVDDDGDEDLWVVVGAGASVEVVSLVLADGCDLVRPLDGATPNLFPIGASVGFVSGIECVDGEGFLQHDGENDGRNLYRGTSTMWRVEDGAISRDGTDTFEIDLEAGDFAAYAGLTCT